MCCYNHSESKNSAENLNPHTLLAFVYLQAALSFNGAATGPLLGIFLLGALFPWANWLVSIMDDVVEYCKFRFLARILFLRIALSHICCVK